MDKKLIVMDLDGTLLDESGKNVSDYNVKVVRELIKLGHIVCISTGRAWEAAEKFYKKLNLDTLIGAFNGGFFFHPLDEKYKPTLHTIDKDLINRIINSKFYIEKVANSIIEYNGKCYKTSNDGEIINHMINMLDIHPILLEKDSDNKYKINEDPFSILIEVHDVRNIDALYRFVEDRLKGREVTIQFYAATVNKSLIIELDSTSSNKIFFVKEASKYYKIDQKDIICIGDAENDLRMVKYAGHGVAMKNGIEKLKDAANQITKHPNSESGVGRYFNEYFKLNIPYNE